MATSTLGFAAQFEASLIKDNAVPQINWRRTGGGMGRDRGVASLLLATSGCVGAQRIERGGDEPGGGLAGPP
jgi:hypothetical protein